MNAPLEQTQTSDVEAAALLERIVLTFTAFPSFAELVNARGGYRPTINTANPYLETLADAYDKFQEARGDARRANRYNSTI